MLHREIRRACRKLQYAEIYVKVSGEAHARRLRTKEKLILVDHVRYPEINSTKYKDERLNHTVSDRDNEDEDRLGVDCSVIQHRGCIQLSKVYR